MRDSRRISHFCDMLVTMWLHKCPDMRFGQLVTNVFSYIESKHPGTDVFYIEDDDMTDLFMEWFDQLNEGGN